MCGIIGYVGHRASKPLLLQGLKRLEYRGYDSAGIALLEEDGLDYTRAVGPLDNLVAAAGSNGSLSTTGLGHTRWATHGGVTEANAHPLTACDERKLAIVHERDRRELPRAARGAARCGPHASRRRPTPRRSCTCSRTPTTATSSPRFARCIPKLEGHFTFVVIHHDHPNHLVGVRHQTPMVVGIGDGENFLASNLAAFLAGDAPRAVPGRRRDRLDHARSRRDRRRDRRAQPSSTTSSRSTGTTKPRSAPATRRSCSRRSTSSRRASPRRSATAFATATSCSKASG